MAENLDSAIYNIKAVVAQTGLNPATIRAWERRYGLPKPHRTAGGHRQYSQRDVDTLKWLISRQDEGMSISHAADLWQALKDSGEDPLQSAQGSEDSVVRTTTPVVGKHIDELRAAWIDACLSFDRDSAEQVLDHAFALFSPETVCIQLIQEGLVEIGDGWHQGKITVQQEHFTSALSEQKLEILIAAVPPPSRQENIVVSAAPGERHTFGPLVLTYLLRRRGWDVIHLGADVPAEDFGATIAGLRPQLVIVSAQLLHTAASVKEAAQSIQAQDVLFAYGGRVFNLMPEIRHYIPGHFLGATLEDAIESTANLLSQRPPNPECPAEDESYRDALARFRERESLIEAHVWDTFVAANKPTEHLTAINHDISQTLIAGLKLGNINILATNFDWIEQLLISYRLSSAYIRDYMAAYYQAAKVYLGEPPQIIVDWLAKLTLA